MQKLNLSDWGSIAEIAGTLAVVISLIFVAFNLERNTNAISGQSADEIYDSLRGIELAVLQDPELLMIIVRGTDNADSLSEVESERFKHYIALWIDLWEQMWSRQSVGLIQPETMEGWNEYFGEWTKRVLTREIWEEIKWNYAIPGENELTRKIETALSD